MSLVSVEQVKSLGRITTTTQDVVLQGLIDSAESYVEAYCDIELESTARTETLCGGTFVLYLRAKPISAVASITKDDILLSEDDYIFSTYGIAKTDNTQWDSGLYTVEYTAGHIEAPSGILLAIQQMTLRAFSNFEARSSEGGAEVNLGWQSLWSGNDISALLEQFSFKTVLS